MNFLRNPTPLDWVDAVLANFDSFLIDHAACERKASALAMSFVVKFPDRTALLEPMICLAKEELAHFHEVYRLIRKRGLQLQNDEKDTYIGLLLKQARHGREEHFMDRLLMSAVIEARGCERFTLLGKHFSDPDLKKWYQRLGKEEAGHYKIFVNAAQNFFPEDVVKSRLQEWVEMESEVMLALPYQPRVH